MKRILSLVLCAALLASLSVTIVSATEIVTPYMEAYSSVEFDNPSNYAVVIPETIDANAGQLSFTATQMNLHDNEMVKLYVDDSTIDLTSTETDDVAIFNFNAENNLVASFSNKDTVSHFMLYPTVDNRNEIAAAHYTGTATFRINLIEGN